MADLFVSFFHKDEGVAYEVQKFIHAQLGNRLESFMSSDKDRLAAGDDWLKRILDELRTAKLLVSMLSPGSVRRPWINFEAGAAWMGGKVIPVCFKGLKYETIPRFYFQQCITLGSDEEHYNLVRAIALNLGIEAPSRPLLLEPMNWAPSGEDDYQDGERELTPYEIDLNERVKRESAPYEELTIALKNYGAIPRAAKV